MTISPFSHLSNNLQLSWRTLFQVSCIESHVDRSRGFIYFYKRIWAQNILLPIFNQCFETKITEHGHMTFIYNDFKKFEKLIFSLRETLWAVEATTFPIEDNTVRMNFANVNHHLFGNLILRISFIGFNKISNVGRRSFIDKNTCSLLRLLFNSSK